MEKRIEKWESLRLEAQKFNPHEFVAKCEAIIDKQYEVDPTGLVPGVHAKYDKDQDKVYRSNDHSGPVFTSNTVHEGAKLYYIGLGWGDPEHSGQLTWPDPTKTEAEMLALGIDILYLFSNKPGEPTSSSGGIKVYGGKIIENILHNVS